MADKASTVNVKGPYFIPLYYIYDLGRESKIPIVELWYGVTYKELMYLIINKVVCIIIYE